MNNEKRLSVVLPAYHEEAVIGKVLDQIRATVDCYEVIVVDDGSTDKTAEIARQAGAKVVRHPYNLGNGAAVKSGIRAASGDYILLMDADGQHPPSVIPEMLHYADEYAMVVGARSKESDAAAHRNVANGVFNRYASYVVGYPVPDLTSGFRLIRADIAKSFVYLLPNGFSYPTTLTISLFRAGYPVKYVPFKSPARVGKSKIRPLKDGMRFLLTITRLAVFFVPLKIFLPLAIVMLTTGGGYTAMQILLERRFSGFGGLVTTAGLLIFLLGLIAEQIAMLRLQNTMQEDSNK